MLELYFRGIPAPFFLALADRGGLSMPVCVRAWEKCQEKYSALSEKGANILIRTKCHSESFLTSGKPGYNSSIFLYPT